MVNMDKFWKWMKDNDTVNRFEDKEGIYYTLYGNKDYYNEVDFIEPVKIVGHMLEYLGGFNAVIELYKKLKTEIDKGNAKAEYKITTGDLVEIKPFIINTRNGYVKSMIKTIGMQGIAKWRQTDDNVTELIRVNFSDKDWWLYYQHDLKLIERRDFV